MKKNDKILIISIYFAIICLAILLVLAIFTENGANIFETIFSPKHYISFDKLEEVTVCYKSNTFSAESNEDTSYCEVIVKDKEFLELIEKTYRNKIVNDYFKPAISSCDDNSYGGFIVNRYDTKQTELSIRNYSSTCLRNRVKQNSKAYFYFFSRIFVSKINSNFKRVTPHSEKAR